MLAAIIAVAAAPVLAQAQGSMAQCRAQMPAAAAQRLRACDEHGGCRAVLRIIDSCPALKTFADLGITRGDIPAIASGIYAREASADYARGRIAGFAANHNTSRNIAA